MFSFKAYRIVLVFMGLAFFFAANTNADELCEKLEEMYGEQFGECLALKEKDSKVCINGLEKRIKDKHSRCSDVVRKYFKGVRAKLGTEAFCPNLRSIYGRRYDSCANKSDAESCAKKLIMEAKGKYPKCSDWIDREVNRSR